MKLYEITEKYQHLLESVPEDGEVDTAFIDTLDAVTGEFEEKAKAVTAYICNQNADVDILKAHKAGIDARIKKINARNDSLKNYLRENMSAAGLSKIECPFYSVSLGKASDVCEVFDENSVPDEYKRVSVSVDKSRVLKALKNGDDIQGAKIGKGQERLTIKVS
jgi:phage host-nuclease inhibitor protein Gam